MRRFFAALVGSIGLTAATTMAAGADVGLTENTQVTLSCTDGHSVVLYADPTTLANLTSDVNAINASGTGTICTLDTASIDPTTVTSDWTVFDYNPSQHGIHPRSGPNSMPATTTDGGMTWTFPFKPDVFTALFTTTDPSVTGNMYGKTLHDKISVNGDPGSYTTQNQGMCSSNVPAFVRFYFTSRSSSGSSFPAPGEPVMSGGTPPRGFYTNFWWSDEMKVQLDASNQPPLSISETMTPSDWSDWDGQPASSQAAAFMEAAQNVQSIGLSFGGTCFFETGVTPAPDTFTTETFSSEFSAG